MIVPTYSQRQSDWALVHTHVIRAFRGIMYRCLFVFSIQVLMLYSMSYCNHDYLMLPGMLLEVCRILQTAWFPNRGCKRVKMYHASLLDPVGTNEGRNGTDKTQTNNNKAIFYAVGFRQSKAALFDWTFFRLILLVLLFIVSRVDFIFFVLCLEAVGVREYCCTAGEIGWQLCASRCLREQRLEEPSSQQVGGFGLSRRPPKLRSWSCTQPRAAKATAGAAVLGGMGPRPSAAAVV